jgi:hypothetical protein
MTYKIPTRFKRRTSRKNLSLAGFWEVGQIGHQGNVHSLQIPRITFQLLPAFLGAKASELH